ncbi:hypothetical protein [Rheinheimera faecalis]|uniref:hypothetical protein n=1 Tax=Rheinheimera faecalis TaxID=2901141 RepID=UPI001E353F2E|nr:hypothetical protein [Rheinheimera faecalis]
MSQNPFSFYDFLGYMIPGAVMLYLLTFIFGFDGLVVLFGLKQSAADSSVNQIMSYIPSVLTSYLLGHILAIGSSAIVEAYTNYANGYPSEFLFDADKKGYFSSKGGWRNLGRLVLWFVILPISALSLLLNGILRIRMFNQAKSLPDPLRATVFSKCLKVLEEEIGVKVGDMDISRGVDGDYLRLLYHFAFENSERHAGKLQNYVALYGLTRNVSFVFVILFWGSVFAMFTGKMAVSWLLVMTFACLSFLFYIGFVKFYRRYSLEAIMAVSVYSRKK